jgi:transposase-like protein
MDVLIVLLSIFIAVILFFAYKDKTCNRCKKFIWEFHVISVDYSKATRMHKCPKCNYEFEKEIRPEISGGF